VELDVGLAAGVTDRGLRHTRNEDAMALAATMSPDGPAAVAVVCDGVSSAPRADEASLTACVRAKIRRPPPLRPRGPEGRRLPN
jgi:serine/threonine protein phosphatase PrpC